MSQLMTADATGRTMEDGRSRVLAQADVLIGVITGTAREQLKKLPVPGVYDRLCAQLRAVGLEPAEAKVLRVATWISECDGVAATLRRPNLEESSL